MKVPEPSNSLLKLTIHTPKKLIYQKIFTILVDIELLEEAYQKNDHFYEFEITIMDLYHSWIIFGLSKQILKLSKNENKKQISITLIPIELGNVLLPKILVLQKVHHRKKNQNVRLNIIEIEQQEPERITEDKIIFEYINSNSVLIFNELITEAESFSIV